MQSERLVFVTDATLWPSLSFEILPRLYSFLLHFCLTGKATLGLKMLIKWYTDKLLTRHSRWFMREVGQVRLVGAPDGRNVINYSKSISLPVCCPLRIFLSIYHLKILPLPYYPRCLSFWYLYNKYLCTALHSLLFPLNLFSLCPKDSGDHQL